MNNNTNIVGKVSETRVLLWCIEHNIVVSIPYGEKAKYDQIWDINGKLIRVQVKTSRYNATNETIEFNCYSVSNGKKYFYTKADIDYFATWFDGNVYLISVDECNTTKKLRVSDSSGTAKYAKHNNWIKNYYAEDVIESI